MSKALIRRVTPYLDESLRGYIIRLAQANHTSPRKIYKLASLIAGVDPKHILMITSKIDLSELSMLTHLTEEQLLELTFFDELGKYENKEESTLRHISSFGTCSTAFCQICPFCLIEEPYHRKLWEIRSVTVCPIHLCRLITSCPDCHKNIYSKDQHYLTQAMKQTNILIEQYFKGTDGINDFEDQNGKLLLEKINTFLKEFSPRTSPLSSNFTVSGTRLKSILEKLSLQLSSDKFGLGSHNLLFIAVELLLLNQDDFTGLKIALIEEIEAHIHPQAQLRLIDFLQKEAKALGIQLLLTTHSTVLASKVSLDNLILCSNGFCFPMDHKSTKLEKGDYSFLERFLDSTKANLFFAKGVILVEGDAENLLIPMIAEIIERPLSSYGATIVNVGSTAFLRYSRIFLRQDEVLGGMNIPVAVITDNDIRPDLYKNVHPDARTASDFVGQDLKRNKIERFTEQTVKAFVSPFWTLEYDIAAGSLTKELYKAVLYAKKIEGSKTYGLTEDKQKACDDDVDTNLTLWKTQCSKEEIAFKIYHDILLADSVSKAIVAQCLAKILEDAQDKTELKVRIMQDPNLKYLIDAITYATGGAIYD